LGGLGGEVFERNYVPILRWKAGEKRALRALFQEHRAQMLPLIEWSRQGEVKPPEDRIPATPKPRDLTQEFLKYWGGGPFFCDLRRFWTSSLGRDAVRLRQYAAAFASGGVWSIPVVELNDLKEYQDALLPLTSTFELCVRLRHADIAEATLAQRLQGFLQTTGRSPDAVHIVVDLGHDYRDANLAVLCERLPNLLDYRTFTVAAGSFPMDLTELKGPQVAYFPRHEWVRYHHQVEEALPRIPMFGDYATLHPVLARAVNGLNPSASIRYASDDAWLVMKGEALRKKGGPGHAQYFGNAALLSRRPDYRGPEFSAGDRYIHDVANREAGPGTPTTWVQAGVNHHLTFVAQQVSDLFGVLASREGAAPGLEVMRVRERRREFPSDPGRPPMESERGGGSRGDGIPGQRNPPSAA
jgi:hypothetical protein